MTAQAREILLYKGEEFRMAAQPLYKYLKARSDIKFVFKSTACWRGYYGKWAIYDNKLYLIGLKAYIEGQSEVNLQFLFPGYKKVFADWFTGEVRIPFGELLKYIHIGYASIYEKELIIKFQNGLLIGEKEIDNREEYMKKQLEREKRRKLKKSKFWEKTFWKNIFDDDVSFKP